MNTTAAVANAEHLRPTQGALGLEYARAKCAATLAVPSEARIRFMRERALRVVRGPAGLLHVIDHHHWARAWCEMGIEELPVEIAEDFSACTPAAFAAQMNARGWLHPFGPDGQPIAPQALPESIMAMPDDPYQSIAAFVRVAGVYRDPPQFNAKFAWADFFRSRVEGDFSTIAGFAMALAQALKASRDEQARGLPGYGPGVHSAQHVGL